MMRGPFSSLDTERFEFPVLRGARFPELVERADADERFHLFGERLNAQEEIGKRRKYGALAFAEYGFFGADGHAFDIEKWNSDVFVSSGKYFCRCWRLDGPFPLTPALSPGERENRILSLEKSGRLALIETRMMALPLPGGEGRGEGEGAIQSPAPT